jgi:hypothetical protein
MVDVSLDRTPAGRRIEVSRVVDAPAEVAWNLLADTGNWRDWGPPVTGVDPDDTVIEPGTTGRVHALHLAWVPFRIEACEDHRWTWSVFGRSPPADGHRVEPVGPEQSRIVLECPLWAPWYVPLCLLALSNLARLASRRSSSD